VEPSQYLSLSVDALRATGSGLQAPDGGFRLTAEEWHGESGGFRLQAEEWHADDLDAIASLLETSYTEAAGRHFAPDGNWEKYVIGLVEQAGCGVFDPALTRVGRGADGALQAFIAVTRVSPTTAHIAQVAVHPSQRGRGVARGLVEGALRDAARAGHTDVTLIVAESNAAARGLYASLGFAPRATFIAARAESLAVCRRSLSA
jgi:ribosomal protein S18 acetylase RimI-like enzyme